MAGEEADVPRVKEDGLIIGLVKYIKLNIFSDSPNSPESRSETTEVGKSQQ